MIVVVGGFLGILVGSHTFTALFEFLLPHGLRTNRSQGTCPAGLRGYARQLGQPPLSPARCAFAYSNDWGGNVAVLTPVAIAAAIAAGQGARRKVIVGMLIALVVPMVISLNRGMFISLGIGVVYVAFRLALRGRFASLGSLLGVAALITVILVATPLGHLLAATFTSSNHGHSDTTRISASQMALAGARQSPFFGYGEPTQVKSQGQQPPIGTQGQLWTVLYSNGFPAAIFFVGFLVAVLWQTRRARGMAGLWLHTAPLVALPQIVAYGWLPVELQVVMVTAALAYRYCWRPMAQPEASAPGEGPVVAEGIPRSADGKPGHTLRARLL